MSALALLPREDSGLGWLVQGIAVFIFLVLPVLRSIQESRKRAAGKAARPGGGGGAGGGAGGAQRSPGEAWRELLEGRAPARSASPEAAPRPASPPRSRRQVPQTPVASSTPAPRPSTGGLARPLEPLREPLQPSAGARPVVPDLGGLSAPLAGALAAPLGTGERLQRLESDPGQLDEDLVERWGTLRRPAVSRAAEPALAGSDWRRAVMLSEVLAPPLSLRGPTGAWVGPPLGLSS